MRRLFRLRPLGLLFTALIALVLPVKIQANTVRTIAGTGDPVFCCDGNDATVAKVNQPYDVWVDISNNIYIADTNNHRIRKIDNASGIINTVAGENNTGGYIGDGMSATASQINGPRGVCVDPAGNIYIADTVNNRIRKVAVGTQIITTVAGDGTANFAGDGGLATAAQINQPNAIFVDPSGTLYIADTGNSRIRKIDAATGIISTVAGGGAGGDGVLATNSLIPSPTDVFVDSMGNMFITSTTRIRKVTATTRIITTFAGNGTFGFGGDGGGASAAKINYPAGIFGDSSGNIYFSDTSNHRIRKVNAGSNTINTVVGTGVAGYNGEGLVPADAQINKPIGIFVDPTGVIYFADSSNNRIRKDAGAEPPKIEKGQISVYGNLIDFTKNTKAKIFVKGNAGKKVEVAVYDRGGRRVAKLDEITLDSSGVGEVEFMGLNDSGKRLFSGIYFVVVSGDVNYRERIIIKGVGK